MRQGSAGAVPAQRAVPDPTGRCRARPSWRRGQAGSLGIVNLADSPDVLVRAGGLASGLTWAYWTSLARGGQGPFRTVAGSCAACSLELSAWVSSSVNLAVRSVTASPRTSTGAGSSPVKISVLA